MVKKTLENITILGSSHIAAQSIKEVESIINSIQPDIIALELDAGRLGGLISEPKNGRGLSISQIGFKGYIFSKIGSFVEHRLGKVVGVKPGAEMKRAYELAQKNKARIALIDVPIITTMRKLSNSITWKEKFNFFIDIVKGLVSFIAGKKPEIQFDLRTVPSELLISSLVSRVRERYPNVYRVLIHERNIYMARKINLLNQKFPDAKIFAIMGAGHVSEVYEILQNFENDAKMTQIRVN